MEPFICLNLMTSHVGLHGARVWGGAGVMKSDTTRIMLVESYPFQLIDMQISLNRAGYYNVYPAIDCSEALYVLEGAEIGYRVIICSNSIGLPEMSRLIERVNAMNVFCRVVLLGSIEPAWLRACRFFNKNLDIQGPYAKPMNPNLLSSMIDS
jgi:hypothetical protein